MKIVIFTDGACSGNPGPGGWGAFMRATDDNGSVVKEEEIFGYETATTNNRMEMIAVLMALRKLRGTGRRVQVFSDSRYVLDGIRKWIFGWKRRNWKTAEGKPVKNADLWHEIDTLASDHDVIWTWVKGHAGNPGNIVADRLACKGRDQAKSLVSKNPVSKDDDMELIE